MTLKRKNTFLICFLLCFLLHTLNAADYPVQKFKFDILGIDQGIPQGFVCSVVQDSKGYLWIATRQGLCHFDGYHITNFKNTKDSNSIASHHLRQVYMDGDQHLWLTFGGGGIDLYEYETGRFIHAIPDAAEELSYQPGNIDILGYVDHQLIIARKNGIQSISLTKDRNKKQFTVRNIKPSSSHARIDWQLETRMIENKEGRIWIFDHQSSLHELIVNFKTMEYDLNEVKIPEMMHTKNAVKSSNPFIAYDYIHALIYFQQYQNLYQYAVKTKETKLIKKNSIINSAWVNAVDGDGNIWASDKGKLVKIDVDKGQLFYIASEDPIQEAQKANNAATIYLDHAGNIWVCTTGYGLYKWLKRNAAFNHMRTEGSLAPSIRFINKGLNGTIYLKPWEGTEYRVDSNSMKLLPLDIYYGEYTWENKGKSMIPFDWRKGLPENILKNRDYFIRSGILDQVVLIDPMLNTYSIIYSNKEPYLASGGYVLDSNHTVYIFLRDTPLIRKMDLVSGQMTNLKIPDECGIVNQTILDNHDGIIWMAGSNGLGGVSKINNTWEIYPYANSKETGLLRGALSMCIRKGHPDEIWIGYEGAGLCLFNKKNISCKYITEEDGLSNDVVYGILEDDMGSLWMSTNRGISNYNPEGKKFKNYTYSDGLQSNEFNRYCFVKTQTGKMLFGGINGVNYFNPIKISDNKYNPNIWITDWIINNKSIKQNTENQSLNNIINGIAAKVNLRYNENVMTFQFSSSDLTLPELNKYSYKLEGAEKTWSAESTKREAIYTYLQPGDYTFRLKGTNRDGIWSNQEVSIPFTILAPWWQTWWFKTLVTLSVISLIIGWYQYRIFQIRKVQNIRNNLSADMHDEIGSTLSSITFYSQALLMQDPGSKQKEILLKIKENAQQVQDGLSDIIWSVKASMDSMENVFSRMHHVGSELLDSKSIKFHFDADLSIKSYTLTMTQRKNFYLIFKEAVHNAAKYSQCKNVWVSISSNNKNIIMDIQDDGIGFDTDTFRNGNGLGNMTSRALQMKGTLTINSSKGQGCHLHLQFPI